MIVISKPSEHLTFNVCSSKARRRRPDRSMSRPCPQWNGYRRITSRAILCLRDGMSTLSTGQAKRRQSGGGSRTVSSSASIGQAWPETSTTPGAAVDGGVLVCRFGDRRFPGADDACEDVQHPARLAVIVEVAGADAAWSGGGHRFAQGGVVGQLLHRRS